MAAADYGRVHPETRDDWRGWLEEHHASAPGVWLVSGKQRTGLAAIGYDASVEEALCFGWIDSVQRRVDDRRSMLLFTPRRPRSGWSRPNKERVERLLAEGRIAPAGLAAIQTAKANGSWSLLDEVERLVVPDDLREAFAAHPGAAETWETFPRSVKRGLLEWLVTARRPETRARRLAEIASEAATGRRAGQWGR